MTRDLDSFVKELTEVGGHIGSVKSRRSPSLFKRGGVYATVDGFDIIDLVNTYEQLGKAVEALKNVVKEKGGVMVVSPRLELFDVVVDFSKNNDFMYSCGRWVGGTLTNYSEIKKRVDVLADLRRRFRDGNLNVVTKKEKLDLSRKLEKLEERFGGLGDYKELPKILIIISPNISHVALKEANDKDIPVIGIGGTDMDVENVDYPVCIADRNVSAVKYLFDVINDELKNN